MNVRVRLFAVAKQAAGADAIELDVAGGPTTADDLAPAAGVTVAAVREALVERLPALAAVRRHLLFAVNADYAADSQVIAAGDEVACIPPVSGG
jgi:molybdopterin converting factor small subunit